MRTTKCNSDFAPFSLKRKRKEKHLTSLRKLLKGRRQKFDYLLFDVRVNMGLNLSVFCVGIGSMYVSHILRIELHERVVVSTA